MMLPMLAGRERKSDFAFTTIGSLRLALAT
jgi:hypothetical protein